MNPKVLEEEVLYSNNFIEEYKSRMLMPYTEDKPKKDMDSQTKTKVKEQGPTVLTEKNNNYNKIPIQDLSKINKSIKIRRRMVPSKAKLTENFILKNNKWLEKLKEMTISDDYLKLNDSILKQNHVNNINLSELDIHRKDFNF